MALDDYEGLKAEIAAFLWGRTDLTAQIPTFIRLAEAEMKRKLRTRQLVEQAGIQLNGEYAGLPCDLGDVLSIRIEDGSLSRQLDYMPPEALDMSRFAQPALPSFWTFIDENLVFAPVPDRTYNARVRYRSRFTSLSSSYKTNWVLKKHPDIYLYGALVHSAPYLYEDERIGVWKTFFENAIAEANRDQPMVNTNSVLRSDELTRINRGNYGYNIYTDGYN